MKSIGIGLIGSGFMGKCHALAFGAVGAVFPHVQRPRLEMLADVSSETARAAARQFGFARATGDWRALVEDLSVDIVSITTPNSLHHEMALAAIAAGKHVYCEKPLGVTLAQAEEMAAAAARSGVRTLVGYNYLKNPAALYAKALIERGAIGRVIHFRGIFDEDYMADPAMPGTWRSLRSEAGLGVLGDMGCHLVAAALELAGPVESVLAETRIVYSRHPHEARGSGETGAEPVENEDYATALVRFTSGCDGSVRDVALRLGTKEPARVGGARRRGHAGIRPGASERAAVVRGACVGRGGGLQDHPYRPGPSAVRRVREGARSRTRVQRSEGRGGRAPAHRNRRGQADPSGLRHRARNRADHLRDRRVRTKRHPGGAAAGDAAGVARASDRAVAL